MKLSDRKNKLPDNHGKYVVPSKPNNFLFLISLLTFSSSLLSSFLTASPIFCSSTPRLLSPSRSPFLSFFFILPAENRYKMPVVKTARLLISRYRYRTADTAKSPGDLTRGQCVKFVAPRLNLPVVTVANNANRDTVDG